MLYTQILCPTPRGFSRSVVVYIVLRSLPRSSFLLFFIIYTMGSRGFALQLHLHHVRSTCPGGEVGIARKRRSSLRVLDYARIGKRKTPKHHHTFLIVSLKHCEKSRRQALLQSCGANHHLLCIRMDSSSSACPFPRHTCTLRVAFSLFIIDSLVSRLSRPSRLSRL